MTVIWICYADEEIYDGCRQLIGLNATEAGARARCEERVISHAQWLEAQLHEWRTQEQPDSLTAAELAELLQRVEAEIASYRAAVWSGDVIPILNPGAPDHRFWWITSEELGL